MNRRGFLGKSLGILLASATTGKALQSTIEGSSKKKPVLFDQVFINAHETLHLAYNGEAICAGNKPVMLKIYGEELL